MPTPSDSRIGRSWTIPTPEHVGHKLTIRGRDPIEKHGAYWIDCSCGDAFLVGEAHIDRYIADEWNDYKQTDMYHRPFRSARVTT